MTKSDHNSEVSVKDQLKKFALKSLYGFQTVIVYGLGTRLGIFDYLYKKGKETEADKKSSVSFTLQELSDILKIDPIYLDAWLHMALECGLFEIDGWDSQLLLYDGASSGSNFGLFQDWGKGRDLTRRARERLPNGSEYLRGSFQSRCRNV